MSAEGHGLDTHTVDTGAKLVRMVNQIAQNLVHDKDPVNAVADHVHAFWSARMKQQLFARGSENLDPVARAAVARLASGAHLQPRRGATDAEDTGCDAG
jgi:formate dehydrogenase subunit delta